MYYNDYLSTVFFSIVSFPAGIYEYDIADPYNIYIYKYYGINEEVNRYVGTNTMAAN